MSRRVSTIPLGSWPRRMPADLAAGYVGETNVGDFLKRVGKDYPMPRVAEGRRRQHGEVEAAAVAVICFEWLQRPENVIAGHIRWTGYRTGKPTIRVEHHKTGEVVDHPLEEDGVKFYEEAEEIISHLPKRGVSMVLREVSKGKSKPFAFSTMQHIVQRMRVKLELPSHFTFDACRHGGMTELEEAELTDGQGRALSGHKTAQAYRGYAKETMQRALAATRKRHAHLLAQKQVEVQNADTAAAQDEANEIGVTRQTAL